MVDIHGFHLQKCLSSIKKGDIIGTYDISRDITETKMAKEESKAKELFIANMSHEIRTPVNAIVGPIRVLQKTN